jgi:hypothetical protein
LSPVRLGFDALVPSRCHFSWTLTSLSIWRGGVIGLAGNAISLSINGGASQGFAMSSSFSSVGAQVQFYALTIRHE